MPWNRRVIPGTHLQLRYGHVGDALGGVALFFHSRRREAILCFRSFMCLLRFLYRLRSSRFMICQSLL